MNKIIKDKINKVIAIFIIVIAFGVTLTLMLKYKIEGETNMPFVLSKIFIISSADITNKEDNPENKKWNFFINQYNDFYIEIKKNENYKKDEYIKSVSIENIEISSSGNDSKNVYVFMPNSSNEGNLFTYDENYKVKDSLTYTGSAINNARNLQIGNQGGNLSFRVVNSKIAEYVSDDNDEISYNGTLLKLAKINVEDIKFNISFDIVIKTINNQYRGNYSVELPIDKVETDGVSSLTKTEFNDIIFKREKITN